MFASTTFALVLSLSAQADAPVDNQAPAAGDAAAEAADDDDGEAAALEAVNADDGAGDPEASDPDATDPAAAPAADDGDGEDDKDDDKPLVQRANEKLRDVAQEPLESLWGGPLKPIELPTIEKRSRPLEHSVLLGSGALTVLGVTALAVSLDANNELKSATPDAVDELTTLRDATGITSGVLLALGAAGVAAGVVLLVVDPFDTAAD